MNPFATSVPPMSGPMRHRIRIIGAATQRNTGGEVVTNWAAPSFDKTVWAAFAEGQPKDPQTADRVRVTAVATFATNYRHDLRQQIKSGFRIEHRGETWEIVRAFVPGGENMSLLFECELLSEDVPS